MYESFLNLQDLQDYTIFSSSIVFIGNISLGENIELIMSYNSDLKLSKIKQMILRDCNKLGIADIIDKRVHMVSKMQKFWMKLIRAHYTNKDIFIYQPFEQAPGIYHIDQIIENLNKLGHNGKVSFYEIDAFKTRFTGYE